MLLIGTVHTVWQPVLLRLLAGLLGGYSSGPVVLVATQTPKDRSSWALGTLSTGVMAGGLVGPLVGGALPFLIGIRKTFHLAGGVIFVDFLATCFLIKKDRRGILPRARRRGRRGAWVSIPDRRPVIAMLATAMLLMLANMSVEPIITVYVSQLLHGGDVALTSGVVTSALAMAACARAPHDERRSEIVAGIPRARPECIGQSKVVENASDPW